MKKGFTYPELIVVMAIVLSLFALVTFGALNSERKSAMVATTHTLMSDIRQQQLKAMIGDTDGQASASAFGVHLESDRYILFKGINYSPSDPVNFTVMLDPGIGVTTDFSGGNLIFAVGSGEMPSSGEVTLTSTSDSASVSLMLNNYGVEVAQN
jgi:prepilin-type N-terminal cleavage/methylation domain-containing protein